VNLFQQPIPLGPRVPIPTFIPAEDLRLLLPALEFRWDCTGDVFYENDCVEHRIPAMINLLAVNANLKLDTTDHLGRFAIEFTLKLSLEIFYASMGPWPLLRVASRLNSIELAKRAIRQIDMSEVTSRSHWWYWIRDIRPTWQIELTRLVWVNDDCFAARLPPSGTIIPQGHQQHQQSRTKVMMVQTTDSLDDVAAMFNPPSEVSNKQAFS
jgi:hypothetical protein